MNVIMETAHNLCQHNYAPTPLPHCGRIGILTPMDYELFLKMLGREIRKRRKHMELNQMDFAEAVETDQGSISRIENGKQGLDSPLLFRIAVKLGTLPGELCATAVHTTLPDGIPADAVEVAQKWTKLSPGTIQSIKQIVKLDQAAADEAVAEHIDPAPTGARRNKPASQKGR